MKGDARPGGVALGRDAEARLVAERTCEAAAGRFFVGDLVADRIGSVGDLEAVLATAAKLNAALGLFFGGGAEEELAVGSVPLSPSSSPPALPLFGIPPRNGVVSHIVKPACGSSLGCAMDWHGCEEATICAVGHR